MGVNIVIDHSQKKRNEKKLPYINIMKNLTGPSSYMG